MEKAGEYIGHAVTECEHWRKDVQVSGLDKLAELIVTNEEAMGEAFTYTFWQIFMPFHLVL